MLIRLVLLVASLQCIVTADIYQVSCNGNDAESLRQYFSNNGKYCMSNSQLQLESRKCYLNADLVIRNVSNFSLIGENGCTIKCASFVGTSIFNVTEFKVENINFKNCNKNYSHDLDTTFEYDHVSISKPSRNASIFLYNCTSVVINNISVTVDAGTTGIFAVNVRGDSTLTNISITVDYTSICPTVYQHSEQINGILFCYEDKNNKSTNVQLDNFKFTINGSCAHPLQYVISLLLFQKNADVSFTIKNTIFNNLHNVHLLYYYGETCGTFVRNSLMFTNCVISNNIGFSEFMMLEIILYNKGCFGTALLEQYCNQQYNNITIANCKFVNNHNITSMIHVTPASSRGTTCCIYVINTLFCNNSNTHYLNLESDAENRWQLSNSVSFISATISSNSHYEGNNLLSATNCIMQFAGTTFITSNKLYNNIIKLHFSSASFENSVTITDNIARHVFYGLHIFIKKNTTLDVSFNIVYMIVKQTLTFGVGTRVVCGVQFYSTEENLDYLNVTELPFKVIAQNNTHMTSKTLPGHNLLLYANCQWLSGTAFHTKSSTEVYKQIFKAQNLIIDDSTKRPVPLSVCKCKYSSNGDNSFDCYSPHLGSVYPGETLTVQLSVQEKWISVLDQPRTIIVENSNQDNCTIVHASELSQTYFNDTNHCNNYSYTLWLHNDTITQCQLFIGLNNIPEMFYVQIKPCPKGFTFQNQRKACYCDPILTTKLSITSCNVKDETILRPANSWIFAYKDDNSNSLESQMYKVSLYCPLNYCLPESLYINLSDPDLQCQFNRTGLLCGDCKPGLSVTLGMLQCKPCSNIYLLLLLPIGLVGVVLVMFLYIFNLTVRNPTINTIIFYVNIVKINMFIHFPGCQSVTCFIFSFLNLDFTGQTCFYNGMDDYAKQWWILLYSFYFISIPILFIALSRYSGNIQRLTAQRALPVLATLILLSHTKVVLIVCNVLFNYSTITYLPSNKTEVVWSISTTTPLFGVKFLILFAFCIILFLILLPFNVILLFTRRLSYFALVTKLKPLLDTYFSAYKDKAYYWTGLLLLIRVIVYALSAFDNDISFITISILLTGLLCLHGAVQPFKSKFHNIQESITVANLVVVHTAQLYKKGLLGPKIAQLLLAIGVTYFIIMITIHCCMHSCKNTIKKGIRWLHHSVRSHIFKVNISQQSNEMETFSSRIADVTYNYKEFQEPLVEFDN